MQTHSAVNLRAAQAHIQRRASAVCHAHKAAVASGKVEEAAAVAGAAYQGLPLFWQVNSRRQHVVFL